MSIYKLAGTGAGGVENGLAQLDIQFDGEITAVFGMLRAALDADEEFTKMEVSFISVNTFATNDTRGSVFGMQSQMHLVTSGANTISDNAGIGGLRVAVNAGERLWLHVAASASTVSAAEAWVYVDDGQTAQRRR